MRIPFWKSEEIGAWTLCNAGRIVSTGELYAFAVEISWLILEEACITFFTSSSKWKRNTLLNGKKSGNGFRKTNLDCIVDVPTLFNQILFTSLGFSRYVCISIIMKMWYHLPSFTKTFAPIVRT
ncbi:hypothetical protein TNCV_4384521 [Trichonephila clavipes]|nr:hypothetical protein TNCV_4384521 [Trichonephila clavipes]